MNLCHRDLIGVCSELLGSYNAVIESVDSHLQTFLKTIPTLDENDGTFVEEVFSGCVRFEPIISVVIDGFYNRDGKLVLRSEEYVYRVIAYLILFRAEELGACHLKKFIVSLDLNKMYTFLNFALDEKNIRTWMKDAWNCSYDSTFVANTVLCPLLEFLPELRKILNSIKKRIETAKAPKKSTIPLVEPKPFNLTQPKPIKIPVPERIPRLKFYRPVPETTYVEPKVDAEFLKAKEMNWKQAQKLYREANKQSPSCATKTEKSEQTKQRMREYADIENSKLNFNQKHYNPPPASMLTEVIPVKLNAASILREGKLYQKREEEEMKKFERLEAGYSDDREFNDWQSRMRQIDEEKEQMEQERRRLAGLLSKEEAIIARQNRAQEKKDTADIMRAQAEQHMEMFLMNKLAEEERARKMVEKVTAVHENARESKCRLQLYKAQIVQQMMEESRELMRQALEEAEIVMKQKMELINQIKEMESGRALRLKMVDLTESSGCGLLCEMSIAELRERLQILKMEEVEEEENRRNEIFNNKQAKEQMLLETLETIARHRTEISKANACRQRAERKKPKDETLLKMERMIEEKKAQRISDRDLAKRSTSRTRVQQSKLNGASKKIQGYEDWDKAKTVSSTKLSQSSELCANKHPATSSNGSRLALLAI